MKIRNKAIAIMITCLLVLSAFSVVIHNFVATALSDAQLTGEFADSGSDTDSNGKYDYLEVAVGLNVLSESDCRIQASYLTDQFSYYIPCSASNEAHLPSSPSTQWLNLSFNGPAICASGRDPQGISSITLWVGHDGYYEYAGQINNAMLSHIYNHADFDRAAAFTGNIADHGVDTDSNGLFDALEVDVEVQVFEEGNYEVYVQDLLGASNYVSIYNSSAAALAVGNHMFSISLYGPTIFAYLYSAHGSVNMIGYLGMGLRVDSFTYAIDTAYSMPLTRAYVYSEFESHAYFTGKTFDQGVDTDGDGLYDFLQYGVEINVTKPGNYSVNVGGLMGDVNGTVNTIWHYSSMELSLSNGLYMANFTFPGPMIAYYRLNPSNVTGLQLSEEPSWYTLNYTYCSNLKERYNYTQFDSTFSATELELTVYPNATVAFQGNQSRTHMYPVYEAPLMNLSLGLSTNGATTTGHANGTLQVPEEMAHERLLDSTTMNLLCTYHDEMLHAQLDAAVTMPPEAEEAYPFNSTSGDLTFSAQYLNGIADIGLHMTAQLTPELASQPPFNISDLQMRLDYADKQFHGNITLHTFAGFPLGDIIVDIAGNETQVALTGYVNITYGNLYDYVLNETTVGEYISYLNNLTGQGDGTVYNMTSGIIEFTKLDVQRTPEPYGETVDYNATLDGNFTEFLAMMLQEMTGAPPEAEQFFYAAADTVFSSVQNGTFSMNYWSNSKILDVNFRLYSNVKQLWADAIQRLPATLPDELKAAGEAIARIANATAYAISNAQVQASYHGDTQTLEVTATLDAEGAQLWNDAKPWIPQALSIGYPPELTEAFELYLNASYCEIDTFDLSATFANSVGVFSADWTMLGDFRQQTNHAKSLIIATMGMMGPDGGDWSARMLNETEIDIDNAFVEVRQGSDWTSMSFGGVMMYPDMDGVDPIRFRLYNWLNMTDAPDAPPGESESFSIIVNSGFNGTHTVLLCAPGTVPSPNWTSLDYKTMTWRNTSMCSLKDLLFLVAYQEVVDHAGQAYYVPIFTNSTVVSFGFNADAKQLSFNVAGSVGTGFCNVTIPKSLLRAAPAEWVVRLDGTPLTAGQFSVAENAEYTFIYLNYSHSSHDIIVQGTWVVAEFQPNVLVLVFATAVLAAAAVMFTQRRKLLTLKTRYQNSLRMIALRKQHAGN